MILTLDPRPTAPLCDCQTDWTLTQRQEALLDLVTQARYGQDAAALLEGRSTAQVANAAANLSADIQASGRTGYQVDVLLRVLALFVDVGTAVPAAVWRVNA